MQSAETSDHQHASTDKQSSNNHHFEPCSCCRALAQVRFPDYNNDHGMTSEKPDLSAAKKRFVFAFKQQKNAFAAASQRQSKKSTDSPEPKAEENKAANDYSDSDSDSEEAGHDPIADLLPKKRRLWQGLDGIAVMTFGVVIPSLMAISSCLAAPKRITLLLLNHPTETAIQLLLALSIPSAIYLTWSALCKKNIGYTLARGLAMGASIGTALIYTAISLAALFYGSADLAAAIGTEFTLGFCWIAFLSFAAALTGVYLVNRVRLTRDFSAPRTQIVMFTAAGVGLSLLAFLGSEYRPWSIRLAERQAVSTTQTERIAGLKTLRGLDAERELRMECSDARAAGLSGLFLPIKPSSQRELYFATTGKPYSFREFNTNDISAMPDDDLKRTIVGEKVPGLSLIRSSIDGIVHPATLTSTLNWTFVFKNSSTAPQETRSEIALPPGAVITGLTLWTHGEPQGATVAAAGKAEGFTDNRWQQVNLDSPAIISDLGHGRMLLHCNPVLQEEEMKVAVTIVMPLKPESLTRATMTLPTFLAANFNTRGFSHSLKIRSQSPLKSTAKNLTTSTTGGDYLLTGALQDDQLDTANLTITASRSGEIKPVLALDKMAMRLEQDDKKKIEEKRQAEKKAADADTRGQIIVMIDGSKGVNNQVSEVTQALNHKHADIKAKAKLVQTITPHFIVESLDKLAAPAPQRLMVVVDGSASMKAYAAKLADALTALPAGIKTEIIVASEETSGDKKAQTLPISLAKLRAFDFVGGQNNLKSVINAAEKAGEQKGGAVLWVHGPQPSINEEIYIMSQYTAAPAFYELQVGTGNTDAFDFFKNHSEIGPFSQVPRTASNLSIGDDLTAFFAKWQPDSNDYSLRFNHTTVKPSDCAIASGEEAEELLALNAHKHCASLIAARQIRKAARIALAYGIVSPVSCALVASNAAQTETVADTPDSANPANSIDSIDSTSSGDTAINSAPQGASVGGGGGGEPSAENTTDTRNDAAAGVFSSGTRDAFASKSKLCGVTNGTIGPSCSYVTGINTAGTVRVNNLANLEALLNVIANLGEIATALAGLSLIVLAVARRKPLTAEVAGCEVELGAGMQLIMGIGLIVLGMAVPGLINWFVASARDANLFN